MTAAPNLSDFTNDEIKEVLSGVRHPIEVAVISPGNYFNIASMIRTAHGFLVNKFHIINIDNLSNRELFYRKGTMSCHRFEDIEVWDSEEEFIFQMKAEKKNIVSFERRPGELNPKTVWDYSYPDNCVLVFGSEKTGVSEYILGNSVDNVCIPQFGITNDLNLSVAFGIAINDWVSKHYKNRK